MRGQFQHTASIASWRWDRPFGLRVLLGSARQDKRTLFSENAARQLLLMGGGWPGRKGAGWGAASGEAKAIKATADSNCQH